MEYLRLCGSLANGKPDGGRLIPFTYNPYEYVKDLSKPHFLSTFIYNDNHYERFKRDHTIAGIEDVNTNKIYFDFDDEDNPEAARKDAIEMCARLQAHGIPADQIQVCFSGFKGFSVEVRTTKRFTPKEIQTIALKMSTDLATLDKSMYNASRVFRLPATKHPETSLFKFPLTVKQLAELPINEIKELAKDIDNCEVDESIWSEVNLSDTIMDLVKEEKLDPVTTPTEGDAADLDFHFKPKGLSNCKFAIMHGFFPGGCRNNALMALGATLRAQGYPKEVTYGILKSSARLQGIRTGTEAFSKEDIWNTIINVVYGTNWKGAQFSCKNQPWLKEICDSLGKNKCRLEAHNFIEVRDISTQFEDFSLHIEKNTIKTGLASLDENIQLTVGMPVGILGAPSSGKTSLSLNILNNTSKAGIPSIFFSMDMFGPLVYLKQIQKLEGLSPKEVHHIFKHDKKRSDAIKAKLQEEYKNVRFSLKAGHTVADMREMVNDYQESSGEKVKLVLIDYLECISGPYSDATANSGKIAGELRDFATEMGVCCMTLVQPPKSAGTASDALLSMRQIKGSSMLEQSFRAVLGIYRDGFGPTTPEDDKFMTINALKNTMGPLFSVDYYWDGRKGEVREIDEEGESELHALRKRKEASKSEGGSSWE